MRHFIISAMAAFLTVGVVCVHAAPLYSSYEKDRIFSLVVPTHTMAIITDDCSLKNEPSAFAKVTSELSKGAMVEVLQDSSENWYKVENSDEDAVGWLPAKYLEIIESDKKNLPEMSAEDLEAFANIMNFPTKSGFFIWTDIARQKTHAFEKTEEGFKFLKTFDCATGKPSTPTTRGFFIISERGEWFYSMKFKSGAMYWMRFNKTYLFHSVAMDKNKEVQDGALGERRSSGCVRHSVADSEWLYNNIPDGTSVFIH